MASPSAEEPFPAGSGLWDGNAQDGGGVFALPPLDWPSVLATLVINLLSLAMPLVAMQVYDRVLPNHSELTLVWLMGGLAGVIVLEGIVHACRGRLASWNGARFEFNTACRAFARILAADVAAFEASPPGVHVKRFEAIDQLRDFCGGPARWLHIDCAFALCFVAAIAVIAPPLAAIPLLVIGLSAVTSVALARRLRRAILSRDDLDGRRNSFVLETLGAAQTVKMMAMECLMERRHERLQGASAVGTSRIAFLSALSQDLGAFSARLTLVLVAAGGAYLAVNDTLSIGGLAAVTLLAGRTVQAPLKMLASRAQIERSKVGVANVRTLLELPAEDGGGSHVGPMNVGAVRLEAVSFAYGPGASLLLDRIDLDIAGGETIGITGDGGAGKSTLLLLLAGLLQPPAGRILFDGIDARAWSKTALRRDIAYLPQSEVLFRGTILDNLTLFRPAAVPQALAAVRSLGLDAVINRLPAGYSTSVGDGADGDLPAGIRQGLALARALAADPRLLLFDEANSALDLRADALLKAALARLKGRMTIVLVSRRPSLLALADRVLRLEGGALVPVPAGAQAAAPDTRQVVSS